MTTEWKNAGGLRVRTALGYFADLDDQAEQLLDCGQLRAFDTTSGSIYLGYIDVVDRQPQFLGEIEGYPEETHTSMSGVEDGGPFPGIRDVFTFEPTQPGRPIEWCWLAGAHGVPAVVAGIHVPELLRQRIAAAVQLADHTIDLGRLFQRLAQPIDDDVVAIADEVTAAVGASDNGAALGTLLTALADPVDQRITKLIGLVRPDGYGGDADLVPVNLDGSPGCESWPRPTGEPCGHDNISPTDVSGAYVCDICDETLVEIKCSVCDALVLPHQLPAHLARRCWEPDT